MPEFEQDEGDLLADLLAGTGQRERFTAPEPSLLPHLAANLCHDFSIPDILDISLEFGEQGSAAPPYPALYEAVVWAAVEREDLQDKLPVSNLSHSMLTVLRALKTADTDAAQNILHNPVDLGPDFPAKAAVARIAPLLDKAQVEALRDSSELLPDVLDAESVRSLLVAFNQHELPISDRWLYLAEESTWRNEFRLTRRIHLLPELSEPYRTRRADALALEVAEFQAPQDMRALWVSRVAPYVSSPDVWDNDVLYSDLDDVWRDHIGLLQHTPKSDKPWEDVFQAHPEWQALRNIERPHESTADVPMEIANRWLGASRPTMSMPEESSGAMEPPFEESAGPEDVDGSAPPAAGRRSGPPPAPDNLGDIMLSDSAVTFEDMDDFNPDSVAHDAGKRRLQADVSIRSEPTDVIVKGRDHLIEISIGHAARVRLDRAFDESIFDESDAEELILPVVFTVGEFVRDGKIRVPRDSRRNSTVWEVLFPADLEPGAFEARIHLYRPGSSLLLQSALLAGEVVTDPADATAGFALTTDIITADRESPPSGDPGASITVDEQSALINQNIQPVKLDTSMLQEHLTRIVNEIEIAAGRKERNPAAASKTLVDLARAGQALRTEFEAALGPLMDADILQIVSLRESDVLPLELIYDGPALSLSSQICPNWQEALRSGKCDNCESDAPGDSTAASVCPLHFWSMHKVIERRTATSQEDSFTVASERSSQRTQLRSIEAVVVGASSRVAPDDIEKVRETAAGKLSAPASIAVDWDQWKDAIVQDHPELLIAMPHNESISLSTMLMLGEPLKEEGDETPPPDANALLKGSVSSAHVHLTEEAPGPIALLLGCNTQYRPGKLGGFVGEFHQCGAALTVGTIGELVADQAPRAAQIIVEELAAPGARGTGVGEVLLRSRRRLLSEGMIMALLLVGNGDAQWQLPP